MPDPREMAAAPCHPPSPAQAWIEITNRCNFHCLYCAYPRLRRPKQDMPPELFRRVVDSLAEVLPPGSGVSLHLMGEPLLHPDIFDYIRLLNDRGLQADLWTNGLLLDSDVVDRLSELRICRLGVSVMCPDAQAYRQARPRARKSWEQYSTDIESAVDRYLQRWCSGDPAGISTLQLVYMWTRYHRPGMQGLEREGELLPILERWADRVGRHLPHEERQAVRVMQPGNIREFHLSRPHGAHLSVVTWDAGDWTGRLLEGHEDAPRATEGTCENPFRQLLVFSSGRITLCCEDAEGELGVGDARWADPVKVWRGPAAARIREGLREGRLLSPLCQRCRALAEQEDARLVHHPGFSYPERSGEQGPVFQWFGRHGERIMGLPRGQSRLELAAMTLPECLREGPQRIRITAPDGPPVEVELPRAWEWFPLVIELPAAEQDRFVLLHFEAQHEITPSESGGEDRRLLSAAIAFPDLETPSA